MYKSNNPIEDWYQENEVFRKMLDSLSNSDLTPEQQAQVALKELSKELDLPLHPADICDRHYERFQKKGFQEPRSVEEELAIISYLEPDDDIRGRVALALCNVYHGIQLSLVDCAKKYFGSKKAIPQQYSVCFLGEGIDVRLHFLKDGESWYELGAQKAVKIV